MCANILGHPVYEYVFIEQLRNKLNNAEARLHPERQIDQNECSSLGSNSRKFDKRCGFSPARWSFKHDLASLVEPPTELRNGDGFPRLGSAFAAYDGGKLDDRLIPESRVSGP